MAVVGEAFIIVRPITAGFENTVRRDFDRLGNVARRAGTRAGKQFGGAFGRAFGPSGLNIFSNDQLKRMASAQRQFASLSRVGFFLQTSISTLLSSVGSLVTGLISLGAAAAGAAPSLLALGSVMVSIGLGAAVAKLALSGVGAAVSKLNKQQVKGANDTTAAERRVRDAKQAVLDVLASNKEAILNANKAIKKSTQEQTEAQEELNKALADGNEQLQQLNFDAEDAALAEKRAANELEDARKTLARVQDLPPNSRARREAELAYAEADLNLRRAKDRNADLKKEQDRLAQTGVEGLDSVIAARKAKQQADEALQESKDALTKEELDAAEREKRARQNQKDAEDDLAKAKAGGGAGGDDPLAGLTESQKKFAKFLASLKPKIDELKEIAAAAFLPKLQEAIQQIVDKAWPTIEKGVAQIAGALGTAAKSISDAIVDAGNLKDLGTVMEDAAENIEILGRIAGNVWGIVLSTLIALDPLTKRFLGWLETTTAKWESFLDTTEGQKQLEDFFNLAGDIAAEFGDVFREIFSTIGNLVKVNFSEGGAGWYLLDWFEKVFKNFNDFANTVEGQDFLKTFFSDSVKNATAALESIGAFVKEILKAGADPNIKVFWDTLKTGAPIFGEILNKSNSAAPALAKVVVEFLKLINIFTQGEQLTIFFNTFAKALEIVNAILSNKVVKTVLDFTAKIAGFLLAIGGVVSSLQFFAFVIGGIVMKAFNVLFSLFNIGVKIVRGFIFVFNLLKLAFAANPVGVIIIAITALIALFVVLYKKNEGFRELVQKVWAAIKDAIGAAWDFIKVVFEKIVEIGGAIWDGIKTGIEAVWKAVQVVWDLIVAGIKLYIKTVTAVIEFVWDVLKTGLEAVWDGIKFVWDLIVAGVKLYIESVTKVIKFVWDVLKTALDTVWNGIKAVWDIIVAGVKAYIATVKGIIEFVWNVLKTGLETVWNGIKGVWNTITSGVSGFISGIKNTISGVWNGLKSGLEGAWELAKNWWNTNVASKKLKIGGFEVFGKTLPSFELGFPRLAEGGIVSPRAGGTIAQIAEAGRPERVEPLDPDGLSKRDKAMISLLTKGGTTGATFNIYPSPGMDEVELASLISRQIAFQNRRGAA